MNILVNLQDNKKDVKNPLVLRFLRSSPEKYTHKILDGFIAPILEQRIEVINSKKKWKMFTGESPTA